MLYCTFILINFTPVIDTNVFIVFVMAIEGNRLWVSLVISWWKTFHGKYIFMSQLMILLNGRGLEDLSSSILSSWWLRIIALCEFGYVQ